MVRKGHPEEETFKQMLEWSHGASHANVSHKWLASSPGCFSWELWSQGWEEDAHWQVKVWPLSSCWSAGSSLSVRELWWGCWLWCWVCFLLSPHTPDSCWILRSALEFGGCSLDGAAEPHMVQILLLNTRGLSWEPDSVWMAPRARCPVRTVSYRNVMEEIEALYRLFKLKL